jgi:hypothetical protein
MLLEQSKETFQSEYGRISTSSTKAILRKLIELDQQSAPRIFGERSFDVEELVIKDRDTNANVLINKTDRYSRQT